MARGWEYPVSDRTANPKLDLLSRHLAETSRLALLLFDGTGRCSWRNEAARRMLGEGDVPWLDVEGRPLSPEELPWGEASLERESWGPRSLRLPTTGKDFTWVCACAERLKDDDGSPSTLVLLKAEEGCGQPEGREQGEKIEAMCRVVGRTAHDCNNNLGVIGGYTEILEECLPADGEARSYMGPILEATALLTERLQNLLAYRGGRVSRPADVDLASFLEGHRHVLAAACGEDMDLIVEVHAQGGILKIDPLQLEWLLCELGANARRAAKGQGRLELRVECLERPGMPKELRITVKDDGAGMSEGDEEKALDGGYSTRHGRGRGLGLPTVQTIVHQHGGRMRFQSKAGQGTTVILDFPWVAAPDA